MAGGKLRRSPAPEVKTKRARAPRAILAWTGAFFRLPSDRVSLNTGEMTAQEALDAAAEDRSLGGLLRGVLRAEAAAASAAAA